MLQFELNTYSFELTNNIGETKHFFGKEREKSAVNAYIQHRVSRHLLYVAEGLITQRMEVYTRLFRDEGLAWCDTCLAVLNLCLQKDFRKNFLILLKDMEYIIPSTVASERRKNFMAVYNDLASSHMYYFAAGRTYLYKIKEIVKPEQLALFT